MMESVTKLLLAFDIGHTTGVTLAKVTVKPFWHIKYISSFEQPLETFQNILPGYAHDMLSCVDEVWVEYPRLNNFSKFREKTSKAITEWRTFFGYCGVEYGEVLPATWKNSAAGSTSLQSWVYLSPHGIKLSKHELDAFGILFWRGKQLHKEALDEKILT